MNTKLKELKNITSNCCVTIILHTHRTRPDNNKDPLLLKNLVKEAEERLFAQKNKKEAELIIRRIHELANTIDHNHNQESLILFVNETIAEYIRLPIEVEDQVIIDTTFATRNLLRSLQMDTSYFVLLISQQKARLIEAFNDKVVAEDSDSFPIENDQFYPVSKAEKSNANRQTNLIAEFYNRIDKIVNNIRKTAPYPVLICSEEAQYYEYLKIADEKQSIFSTFLNGNRLDQKTHAIVSDAWKIVKQDKTDTNNARLAELEKAVDSGNFLSDTNDIWQAIKQGRVQTIFVEQGKFQPAVLENDLITYVNGEQLTDPNVIDDIYGELIDVNMKYGGDVVFLPKGKLDQFNGLGVITRY
ncbi:hypothetical protein [Empedobacter brevis]|uniref:AOC03_06830 family ribosome hibernation factor n=1 Tax=Empedobacter brevis TaxID=247 RepID=UPI0033427FCC